MDSVDWIRKDIALEMMNIDDVIYFPNMGAYSIVLRTPFHGFEQTKIFYLINYDDR